MIKVNKFNAQNGSSLIAVCFLVIILSGVGLYVFKLADQIDRFDENAVSFEKEIAIKKAIKDFVRDNAQYPCPANLDADFDDADFGVSADCSVAAVAGSTFSAPGRGLIQVRTGAVPVRTLNLPDKYIADGYGTRFFYSVTEPYAQAGAPLDTDGGAVSIVDSNGNSVLERPGTGIFALITPNGDGNGTYDENGNLMAACAAGFNSSENCNIDTDAVFITTSFKSTGDGNNYFMQNIEHQSSRPCDNTQAQVGNVTFLIDDSGSMGTRVGRENCEAVGLHQNCTRMDVAHWAMRRAMPTYMYNNYQKADGPDETYMSGFTNGLNSFNGYDSSLIEATETALRAEVAQTGTYTDYGDLISTEAIDIFDTETGPSTEEDFRRINEDLNNKLENICPGGGTPLGQNILAHAMNTGDGTSDKPNKVIVISDGYHTTGSYDNNDAARDISEDYPNTQIDIIDMTGSNNGLANTSETTGGQYYSVNSPQNLLDSLANSFGSCSSFVLPTDVIEDTDYCGSR